MKPVIFKTLLMLTLLMGSGCTVNLAPTIAENSTYVKPGVAGKVTKNIKVPVKQKGASKSVETDIGGWNVQPPEHWDAIRRTLMKDEYIKNKLAEKVPMETVQSILKEAEKLQLPEEK